MALVSAAFADQAVEPCAAITSPGPNSGLFPLDGQLAAAMVPCLPSARVRLVLSKVGGDGTAQILASEEFIYDAAGVPPLFRLIPAVPLESNTHYLFSVVAVDAEWDVNAVPFQTGDGMVVGVTTPPTINEVFAVYSPKIETLSLTVDATPAVDANHLSLLHLIADGNESYIGGYTPDVTRLEATWSLAAAPEETCFTLGQIDGRGIETTTDEVCQAIDVAHGCSTAATPVSVLWLGLAAVIRRRRR